MKTGPGSVPSPPLPGLRRGLGWSVLPCERPGMKDGFPSLYLLQNINSWKLTNFSNWFLKLRTAKPTSNLPYQLTEEVVREKSFQVSLLPGAFNAQPGHFPSPTLTTEEVAELLGRSPHLTSQHTAAQNSSLQTQILKEAFLSALNTS